MEDIDGLLARHFAGEPLSEGQERQLREWMARHEEEYRRLASLMAGLSEAEPVPAFDAGKAWQKVEPRLKENRRPVLLAGRRLTAYWWVAASLALLLVVGMFYVTGSSDKDVLRYANLGKDVKQVLLPDSSVVVLYPSARLAYADGDSRQVELEGKAFFRVKKNGKRFRVSTRRLGVEVLGTSFLVDDVRQEQAGVYVETGRVRVTSDEAEVIVTAGEKAVLDTEGLQAGEIENPRRFFGRKEQATFDHASVRDVVDEVERQTSIVIELGAGFENRRVTTRLDLNQGESIAAEIAFVCGCRCDTLEAGKHYRLYYE